MAAKWTVGSSVFAALLLAGFAGAPAGHADDCLMNPNSLDCMAAAASSAMAPPPEVGPQEVIPATGGPPVLAESVGPDGGPGAGPYIPVEGAHAGSPIIGEPVG